MDKARTVGQADRFPATRWSLVSAAAAPDGEARLRSLNELLTLYLPALRGYLVTHHRIRPEKADDWIQSFVLAKVLEQNVLAHADAGKGRFRSFLLRVFQNYVVSQIRREQALKRRVTGAEAVSLDEHPDLVAVSRTQEDAFAVGWARQVLAETLKRMEDECRSKGRADLWTVFRARVLDPILDDRPPGDYETMVREIGLASPAQASNLLITGKRMFQRVLREVIRDSVADASDVEQEIAELRQVLAASGTGPEPEGRAGSELGTRSRE